MAEEGLLGSDQFFADEPLLIAVFDIDYDLVVAFKTKTRMFVALLPLLVVAFNAPLFSTLTIVGQSFCGAIFIILLLVYLWMIKNTVRWAVWAQHVALTHNGIVYVVAKHPSKCGCACTDKGKVSKTVPYDMITDCDIEEPAGTAIGPFLKNVVNKVIVDTASSSSGGPGHELVLEGLKEPHQFKKMVWDMKAGRHPASAPRAAAPASAQTNAPLQAAASQNNTILLQKIYDEVRQLSVNLQQRQ